MFGSILLHFPIQPQSRRKTKHTKHNQSMFEMIIFHELFTNDLIVFNVPAVLDDLVLHDPGKMVHVDSLVPDYYMPSIRSI